MAGILKSKVWSLAILLGLAGLWRKFTSARAYLCNPPAQSALNTMWLTVNGVKMHALASHKPDTVEDAPRLPVVLIHGFGVSSGYFIPLTRNLAARFQVYAPDLPGHGISQSPDMVLDIPGLAHALSSWMEAAGIARAMLVGHSMGCQIAVELAVRHPDKVDRIVLIGMVPEPAMRNPAIQFVRLLRCAVHERLSLIPRVLKDYVWMNWRVVPEFLSMMKYSMSHHLPKLGVPLMLVRGEHDALSPVDWFGKCTLLASPACTAVIPGAAHAVHYSEPEKTCAVLVPFLTGTSLGKPCIATAAEITGRVAKKGSQVPG